MLTDFSLSGNPTLKIMGLFIVIFTNTPRNYQNLIFAGIPFIFTLQRYMYTVPVLKQKKKTCFHEQFLAPFLKRHHYNSYGSQELVAAHTHAELKVCPPLPPPPIKNNVPQPPVSFSYWGLPGPLLTSTKSVFCFTLIFWFYMIVILPFDQIAGHRLQDCQPRVGILPSPWFPLSISEQHFPALVSFQAI